MANPVEYGWVLEWRLSNGEEADSTSMNTLDDISEEFGEPIRQLIGQEAEWDGNGEGDGTDEPTTATAYIGLMRIEVLPEGSVCQIAYIALGDHTLPNTFPDGTDIPEQYHNELVESLAMDLDV